MRPLTSWFVPVPCAVPKDRGRAYACLAWGLAPAPRAVLVVRHWMHPPILCLLQVARKAPHHLLPMAHPSGAAVSQVLEEVDRYPSFAVSLLLLGGCGARTLALCRHKISPIATRLVAWLYQLLGL